MKEKVNNPSDLRIYYDAALKFGLVHNQKEFAKLVGISETTISQMLNGTITISNQTMKRVDDAISAKGIHIEGSGNATATGPGSTAQVVSGDLSSLIKEMGEQRLAYMDQLRAKDLQIAECLQLLKEAIGVTKK